ncbi:helix-turn-helix domain-containing protein [Streptomyces sp. NPDC047082]|uniref:helix-turn-helix domain-containing protein n=1 Tax=Streptomyces sp. NPDC047082 TaxID=3155259 RepID=UPI003408331A
MQAAELFALGHDSAAIAKQLRVSVQSVQRWRQAWGHGGSSALESAGAGVQAQAERGAVRRPRAGTCQGAGIATGAGSRPRPGTGRACTSPSPASSRSTGPWTAHWNWRPSSSSTSSSTARTHGSTQGPLTCSLA